MNEPNTRGAERRRDNEPAHAEKAADAAEEQSPWRAANGAREAEPQAESAPKTTGGTKSGQQISSREEIPSREVGHV
jgi:hypothetical protein